MNGVVSGDLRVLSQLGDFRGLSDCQTCNFIFVDSTLSLLLFVQMKLPTVSFVQFAFAKRKNAILALASLEDMS